MPLEIREEILDQADLCVRDRACLEGEENFCCRVTDVVKGTDDTYLHIECLEGMNCPIVCPYCDSFGGAMTCFCPARMEIYRRYRK